MDLEAALVLVPTRELCLQVYEVMKQLVHRFQWLVPGYVMGGENRTKEKARLRKGNLFLFPNIVKCDLYYVSESSML